MSSVDKIVPRMKRLGMPEMKPVAIHLAPKYDKDSTRLQLGQLGFLGYMYEICNFSRGTRTIGEISRALSHEINPISTEDIYAICKDMSELGYMVLEDSASGS